MKKRKVMPLKDSQQDDDFLTVIEELESGLHKIDESFPLEQPNIEWFEQLVVNQKEELRKKLIKEVILFILFGLLVLSGVLYTLYQLPFVFISLQVLVTLFVIFYSARWIFKQVKET